MLGGLKKLLKAVVGDKLARDLKELAPVVELVNAQFEQLKAISNDQLRHRTVELQDRIKEAIKTEHERIEVLRNEISTSPDMDIRDRESRYQEIDKLEEASLEKMEVVLKEILPEAFAVVKETARRFTESETIEVTASAMDREIASNRDSVNITGDKAIWDTTWIAADSPIKWEMIHYDVQLIGGAALHSGRIAEMATGEGKTLVATLPVYLNALTERGVHLVTVNDYLARRDAEWMGPIYEFHGLTVDCIDKHKPNSSERRKAYKADITFGTNNEFGFDYLRDNMAHNPDSLVQRKHHYAIVDEVDSVLIDDARTPLIISGPTPKGDIHEFDEYRPKVEKLYSAQKKVVSRYLTEAKEKLKGLDDGGASKEELAAGGMALLRAYRGLPKHKPLIKYLSESGVKAHLLKTEAFYLQDQAKEMPTVDAELFFTIDEKQNAVELMEKGVDLISGDVQDDQFFVMPDVGAMIADIERSEDGVEQKAQHKDALLRDFSIKSERIHTVNQLIKAYAVFEKEVEYVVMDGKVKIVDEQTGRIMDGRRYSDGLHQAIESKERVKIEAATQTYATVTLQNYFRMYHKLSGMTGTAETEAQELWDIYKLDVMVIPTNRPIARNDSEDMVFKTKREKFNAVIEETARLSAAGRPVLVGTTTVEVSELASRMLKMKGIKHNVLNAKLHQREADIVAEAGQPGAVTIATNMAGRGTDIKLGQGVKEAGGLAILGTEKHESRRVDRQLRGRSGRQGDPGSSQFYVSLEDDLMRIFGSDRISKLMDRMGHEDGEVIQHRMVTNSIERAQKKVEENNFGIRKRLLEYDDVMNSQREVIYRRRRNALYGERNKLDILNMFYELSEGLVAEFQNYDDWEEFKLETYRKLFVEPPFSEEDLKRRSTDEVSEKLFEAAVVAYNRRMETLAQQALPVITDVYLNQGAQYENIVVPITDGIKTMQVVTNLEKSYKSEGRELINSIEKFITLAIIDDEWKEHLREMDELRKSVQNASIEQKDPLLIYKLESFELFKKMVERMNGEAVSFLVRAGLPEQKAAVQKAQAPKPQQKLQTSRAPEPMAAPVARGTDQRNPAQQGMPQGQSQPQPTAPIRKEKTVGRNEPCPCGSGKKFKQCHGKG